MSTMTAPAALFARPGHTPRPRGPRPAAGVLLRAYDPDDFYWYYLLGRRTRSLGGTWSCFGGSLHTGEDPLAGAVRELTEETGIGVAALAGSTVSSVIECGTFDVPYTMFVIDAPFEAFDLDADLSWEHTDVVWVRADVVGSTRLHHGLRRAWEAMS